MDEDVPKVDAARTALVLMDFQVYVLADACADSNPHVHSILTEAVFPHQAYVISTAQLDQLA